MMGGRNKDANDRRTKSFSAGGLAAPIAAWYRRPIILSIVAALTLLIITSSVFTVSLLARDLSNQAQRSHMVNETLRIASGVSTELALMSGYAELSSAEADTGAVVDATRDLVIVGLGNLDEALARPELEGAEHEEIRTTGQTFMDATSEHISALDSMRAQGDEFIDPLVLADLRGKVDDAYRAHLKILVNVRDENFRVLRSTNTRMNRVGSAGGFVIAFLVPAAALYLFEALRRNQGRLRLVEVHAEQERLAQRTAATDAVTRLNELNAHTSSLMQSLSAGATSTAMNDARAVSALVSRATTTAMFNGALQATAPRSTSLHQFVQQCALEVGVARLDVLTDAHLFEQAVVEADPSQLHAVLYELLQNAVKHGSGAVGLEYSQGANYDTLAVIDDGPGLAPDVQRAIFDANSPTLRQETREGAHGVGLIVARAMIEANGGSMDYSRTDGLTRFTLVLPRSLTPSVAAHRPG